MKKKDFLILFDLPLRECDKYWLYSGLMKYGTVSTIEMKYNLWKVSKILYSVRIGVIVSYILIFQQCMRALYNSDKDTIIVTWNCAQGLVMNLVLKVFCVTRKIVSFCWIEIPNGKMSFLANLALRNKQFLPVINAIELKDQLIKRFSLNSWNGIYLPDTYDTNDNFYIPTYKSDRYCFAGGINNRDWDTLIGAARALPNIYFKIVTSKYVNNMDLKTVPSNVKVYFDICSEEYYKILKNAYITICPLKQNRVSGLINIIKSHQYGVPCITADLKIVSIYYPPSLRHLLYKLQDVESMKKRILFLYGLDKDRYIGIAKQVQDFLKEYYSPDVNIEHLITELKLRKWFAE